MHRGVVAAFSRVLKNALEDATTEAGELPLPGKSKAELDLLVAWLYREEEISVVCVYDRAMHADKGCALPTLCGCFNFVAA